MKVSYASIAAGNMITQNPKMNILTQTAVQLKNIEKIFKLIKAY